MYPIPIQVRQVGASFAPLEERGFHGILKFHSHFLPLLFERCVFFVSLFHYAYVKGGTTRSDLASRTLKDRNINNDVIISYDIIVYINTLHWLWSQIRSCGTTFTDIFKPHLHSALLSVCHTLRKATGFTSWYNQTYAFEAIAALQSKLQITTSTMNWTWQLYGISRVGNHHQDCQCDTKEDGKKLHVECMPAYLIIYRF